METQPKGHASLSATTAALLVVASMIGTGVFTTTGFLLRDVRSVPAVLAAWALGGLLALFGALAYAELGAALPRNGGEYALLSRIYHPAVGFMCGVASLVVGFAAPVAASALAFGDYLAVLVPGVPPMASGLALIVVLSLVHAAHVAAGGTVQNVLTAVKIGLIVVFIGCGMWLGDPSRLAASGGRSFFSAMISPELAVGLVFISFAYSGWNAAVYIAGEVREPARDIPRALFIGTAIVTVLYLGLNLVFIAGAPVSELEGQVAVGHIAAAHLFGESAGRVMSGIIAAGLVSTVGALVMTGARVYETMGEDYPKLRFLSGRRGARGPVMAVTVQGGLAAVMLLTSSFEALLAYIGATLSVFAALTVAGVFWLRHREPALVRPYRATGHPLTSVVFVALMAWMVAQTVIEKPAVALAAAATLALGAVGYLVIRPSPVR